MTLFGALPKLFFFDCRITSDSVLLGADIDFVFGGLVDLGDARVLGERAFGEWLSFSFGERLSLGETPLVGEAMGELDDCLGEVVDNLGEVEDNLEEVEDNLGDVLETLGEFVDNLGETGSLGDRGSGEDGGDF